MGRGLHHQTRVLVEGAHRILAEQHPMTLRQLFYRLVSVTLLQNTPGDYGKLSRILTGARERGEIPYEWIVDRSRPTIEAPAWENPAAYAEWVRRVYRRDYWQDQPAHVEVWTEKDAIIGSIEPVTDKWGVTIRVTRGFMSTTRAHEIAETFERIDKPIHVFYLGDHDPSGECIEADAAQRVAAQIESSRLPEIDAEYLARFPGIAPDRMREAVLLRDRAPDLFAGVGSGELTLAEAMGRWRATLFAVRRIAIHAEDIKTFRLPPLRIKTTDSRARAFTRRHGSACVELDALPVRELRARLEAAILALVDADAWNRAEAVEAVEIASIRSVCDRMSGGATGRAGR